MYQFENSPLPQAGEGLGERGWHLTARFYSRIRGQNQAGEKKYLRQVYLHLKKDNILSR
jgi:hypothetical protein